MPDMRLAHKNPAAALPGSLSQTQGGECLQTGMAWLRIERAGDADPGSLFKEEKRITLRF